MIKIFITKYHVWVMVIWRGEEEVLEEERAQQLRDHHDLRRANSDSPGGEAWGHA